jgi:predicted amidohydrolase YtcJ
MTMEKTQPDQIAVPGFVDHHAHLLRDAAGVPFPAGPAAVREFHQHVAAAGSTPMDVLDPPGPLAGSGLPATLVAALGRAAATGLVEVTEMGMRSWAYLEALAAAQDAGPLPARVRLYLASGLAGESSLAELDSRTRQRWPAASPRWPSAAGGSLPTPSATGPRRSCWTLTT